MRYFIEVDTDNIDALLRALVSDQQTKVVQFSQRRVAQEKPIPTGPLTGQSNDKNGLRGEYSLAIAELFRHEQKLSYEQIVDLLSSQFSQRSAYKFNIETSLKRMVGKKKLSVVDNVYTNICLKF
ncbi:hypothetical protein D3C75_224370 [compost metagenome]